MGLSNVLYIIINGKEFVSKIRLHVSNGLFIEFNFFENLMERKKLNLRKNKENKLTFNA